MLFRSNGQREITLSFLYDEVNEEFIHDLEFGWEVLFDGEWYTITHPGYAADGDYMAVDVSAVLSFFVVMNGYYLQDKVEDKSMTAANYFRELFEGTPYTYVLVDHLGSNTLSYQDNQSKTERFLYGIDRFGGEYTIRGRVAYIYEQVGSDKDVILHEDLNVQDAKVDVDASGFHTWAKGFGDLPEGEEDADYQLEVEYVSPLVDKYGYIEGPAIKDGKYKHEDTLIEAVKNQVENSYTISTEVTAIDLTNNGYPEMRLEEGDRVWLVVDRLGLNQQVRVMEIEETFDWEGNIIDVRYTLGNEGIASRYKTQQYNSISDFRDIQSGRKKLEYDWLPDAVRRASYIINGNEDSRFFYRRGEIIGINENNPNGYMRFNTDGIGFSRDGGKTYRTAITYEGIVADAITTGTLRGIVIEGVEIFGAYLQSLSNENTFWNLNTGLFRMSETEFQLGGGADIRFLDWGNRMFYRQNDWASGVGVGRSINDTYPFVYMGVSRGGKPHATDESDFSGFIANANDREEVDDVGNSVVGNRFHVRDIAVSFSKGFLFNIDVDVPYFSPMNTGTYSYTLGSTNNRWADVYAWRYHGSMAQSSTHAVKMGIEDVDGKKAFDYFDMMKVKSFFYKQDDYTNPYNRKVSPIIEQLDPTLEKLYKASPDELDVNSNLWLLALAFQYYVRQTDERLELLESGQTN